MQASACGMNQKGRCQTSAGASDRKSVEGSILTGSGSEPAQAKEEYNGHEKDEQQQAVPALATETEVVKPVDQNRKGQAVPPGRKKSCRSVERAGFKPSECNAHVYSAYAVERYGK